MYTEIIRKLAELTQELNNLKVQAGETDSILVSDSFPPNPYPNQLVIRKDLNPPDGGQFYRYDSNQEAWLQII